MLKSYLMSKNIEYTEKHADMDQSVAQELFTQSGQLGVPFTIIEKEDGTQEKILGFDKPKIDTVLSLN
jgi:glutaredoxin